MLTNPADVKLEYINPPETLINEPDIIDIVEGIAVNVKFNGNKVNVVDLFA